MQQTEQAGVVVAGSPDGVNITMEQVANALNGISAIGHARTVLERAGFTAKITANRIAVNEDVSAQFMSVNGNTWWQVYADDGTGPVCVVGASTLSRSNWVGAE